MILSCQHFLQEGHIMMPSQSFKMRGQRGTPPLTFFREGGLDGPPSQIQLDDASVD